MNKNKTIKTAFIKTIPGMAGYIVLGAGFGILMRNAGFGVLISFLMSVFIFAGSMQYVGVSLLATSASVLTTAITTFMVNARHIFYSVSMIEKYFRGHLISDQQTGEFDEDLKSTCLESRGIVENYLEQFQFSNALIQIFKIASRANKYIDETTPWALSKSEDQKGRLACVLYNLCEAIRITSILLSPFMPETSKKIQSQLNINGDISKWEDSDKWGLLNKDITTFRKELLFPRIDK